MSYASPISEQSILRHWRALTPDQQLVALSFVELLSKKEKGKLPRTSLSGILADGAVDIDAADIADARQEMWGDFPRTSLLLR